MGAGRDPVRVVEATFVASLLSGAPSAVHALATRGLPGMVGYGLDATRAIGTLLPPGKPGLVRGAAAHAVVSAAAGSALARLLPRRHALWWGAAAGGAMGVVNVGIIGRRFPLVRALPLLPQIADNVAFGVIFAAMVDR